LRAIEAYGGQPSTKFALQLAPHVFVRPGELRYAEWEEINFEKKVWVIPGTKTKMGKDHYVPLSLQAAEIMREAQKLGGSGQHLFPSVSSSVRPISENTLNCALRRMKFSADEMTAHGFRAMASTLLNESGKWNPDAIERALAHGQVNSVRAAYHRGAYWDERVQMMQWWSNRLDSLRDGAEIIAFRNEA